MKLKILLVMPQIVRGVHGGWVGGYVNSVINLAGSLAHRHDVTLLAGVRERSAEVAGALRTRAPDVRLELLTIRARSTSALYTLEFALRATAAALRLRRNHFDIVYGHSGFSGYALVTGWLGRLLGARSIHCLYCPHQHRFHHRRYGGAVAGPAKLALHSVDEVVAISSNVANSFAASASNGTAMPVIRPALADEVFAPWTGAKAGTPRTDSEYAIAGFIGHDHAEKGLDVALDAMRLLVGRGVKVKFHAVISGGQAWHGSIESARRMIEERGLQQFVSLHSGVESVPEYLHGLDVLVVPFRGTNGPSDYPMVMLEAMAMGTLVVASRVGAVPEVLVQGETGFLCEAGDAVSLARSLEEAIALRGTDKAKLVEAARHAVAAFRADAVASATEAMCTSVRER